MCTLLSGPSPSDLFGLVGPARAQGPADIAPGIVRTHKLYRPVKACTQDRYIPTVTEKAGTDIFAIKSELLEQHR